MVLEGSEIDYDGDESSEQGKVQAAFSRKRGFTRKRKKLRKVSTEEEQEDEGIFF